MNDEPTSAVTTGSGPAAPDADPASLLHPVIVHHIVNSLGWSALRPLQAAAVAPLVDGQDALLHAPTAGGKTEAAMFPILTRMATQRWADLSVLYVCPLRALLNNLEPRLAEYTGWLGRRVGRWHGDTGQGARNRMLTHPPDVLLTTPESLEAMLCSTRVEPARLFGTLRAVIVDEVHAFAGDDRGWHLLAVLERLARIAGRPLQRVGCSATVGNPEALLAWLQGSNRGARPARSIAPQAAPSEVPDLQLDYVGSAANAATVIAALHRGEKRLVFVDSRKGVEQLAGELRALGVEVFVSHSSLAPAQRRRSEQAFAQSRNCVITATSTLELGVDIGDLDRVVQVGAPRTVASLLQRLGRTGRRPGSARNTLFLARSDDELLHAAGLLLLRGEGYVEPVRPPVHPRHLLAQQLLGLCLQQARLGTWQWLDWLGGLPLAEPGDETEILAHLIEHGFLDVDAGMVSIGPEAERRYGRRHFLEVLSVFTAAPVVTVLHGRAEVGAVDPVVLLRKVTGPRVISLAGRAWAVTHVDWPRMRAHVEPGDGKGGSATWVGLPPGSSYPLTDATRRVLLGATAGGVRLSSRATTRLGKVRADLGRTVAPEATVITVDRDDTRWWTYAGSAANACLAEAIARIAPGLVDPYDRYADRYLRIAGHAGAEELRCALRRARERFGEDFCGFIPEVDDRALEQLKFADLLPDHLARATLGRRLVDRHGAAAVASRGIQPA